MIEPSNADLGASTDSVIEYVSDLEHENKTLQAQVKQLQQTIMQCAELVNVDGGTAIDWLVDNHQNLLEQAKGE